MVLTFDQIIDYDQISSEQTFVENYTFTQFERRQALPQ